MSFSWTPHRFSGGALAFDVANSVVLRHDDARRVDRFETTGQMDSFPKAAANFCAERMLFGEDLKPVLPENRTAFRELREAIDGYFRARVLGVDTCGLLANLLDALSQTLRRAGSPDSLDVATVHSTLRLIATPDPERTKICNNCGWLFVDRSKNRSRTWCDMAVCGNRAKATRHYQKRKERNAP
ncbi:CGNR zinc finger domain-containing protein [Rhizobium sp. RAF56]|jgi:predicted RNA-binding Zn ribbon-like protein|uniref:CGNR zinc finger domain-containing protein n=1 Tax=Rhizobium sp. RAF56 TaxID=3233062 RepID=UPI003F98A14B